MSEYFLCLRQSPFFRIYIDKLILWYYNECVTNTAVLLESKK